MAQKKWVIITTSFLTVALMLAGFVAFAAETGSAGDPAVSQSYVLDEFQPAIMTKIDEIIQQRTDEYAADMNARINQIASQINGSGGGGDSSSLVNNADFINAVAAAVVEQMPVSGGGVNAENIGGMQKVEVKNGKTFTAEIGTVILLRLGTATCVASSSPGLIDTTTATILENGKTLEKNHFYLCTIAGRGFKASADVTIFVLGAYTIQ